MIRYNMLFGILSVPVDTKSVKDIECYDKILLYLLPGVSHLRSWPQGMLAMRYLIYRSVDLHSESNFPLYQLILFTNWSIIVT